MLTTHGVKVAESWVAPQAALCWEAWPVGEGRGPCLFTVTPGVRLWALPGSLDMGKCS